jgi:hypothetical protein
MTPRTLCFSFLLCCQLLAHDVVGKVIDSATGKPIPKCNLMIGNEEGFTLSTLTNSAGNFSFTKLPQGNYVLAVISKGYVPKTYGSSLPQSPGRRLAVNENTPPLLFRLVPTSVISGRVLDEDGDPVEYSTVIDFTQVAAGRVESDGTYRIADILPGEYRLMATTMSGIGTKSFPPVWHSNALIRLRKGETLPNTNFQMRLTETYSLSGRLIPPAGDEAKMYSIRLIPQGASLSLLGLVNPSIRFRTSTGEFEGTSIPAGAYTLQVVREDMHTHEVALRMDLSIYANQRDLLISPRPLAALAGKIEFAKGLPAMEPDKLKIQISAAESDLSTTVRPIPVKDDLTFEAANLMLATYNFSITDPTGAPLLLEKSAFNLAQGLSGPLTLKVTGLTPVLKATAAPNATVLTAIGGEPRTYHGTPSILRLPPGEHSLIAFEDLDSSLLSDPNFLDKLRPLAAKITLQPSDRQTLDVPTLSISQIEKLTSPL